MALTHYEPGRAVDVPALLGSLGIDTSSAERIALTGLSAGSAGLESPGLSLVRVPEPAAIAPARSGSPPGTTWWWPASAPARPSCTPAAANTAISAALVWAAGPLRGLARRVLGLDDMREFDELALGGDTNRVDLLIGDFVESYGQLDPYLTASNLARLEPPAGDADWAAGLTNMVLQVIGTMSMMACMATGAVAVAVIGALAGTAASRENFATFTRAYGTEFIIPEHCECATAIGAARLLI